MSNSENLWRSLRADNLYTKSYEDFKVQFSDKESRDSLYSALKQDNLYTKSSSDFEDQFFKPSNTYRYTKHRKVKNKEEVVSSLKWIEENNNINTNQELKDRTAIEFFGEDAVELMKRGMVGRFLRPDVSRVAGSKRAKDTLNEYTDQEWINLFNGDTEKYRLFRNYFETGVLNVNDINDSDLLKEYDQTAFTQTKLKNDEDHDRYLQGIKKKRRKDGVIEDAFVKMLEESNYSKNPVDAESLYQNPEALEKFFVEQGDLLNTEFKVLKAEGESIANDIKQYTTMQNGQLVWTGPEDMRDGFMIRAQAYEDRQDDFFDRASKLESNSGMLESLSHNYNTGYRTRLMLEKTFSEIAFLQIKFLHG